MTSLLPAPWTAARGTGTPPPLAELTTLSGPPEALAYMEAFAQRMEADCGLVLTVEPEASGPAIRLQLDPHADTWATVPTPVGISPSGGDPSAEAYVLEVGAHGVGLTGRGLAGLAMALGTTGHILAQAKRGHTELEAQRIVDSPRVAWRGLSLDVVRTFFTAEQVCEVIEMMARYKFNVLHLHLTDDQGWRLEIDGWPHLTGVGARGAVGQRPGGYYTAADFTRIVQYAAARAITVIPEIEMPGHSGAVRRAYPHLAPAGRTAGSHLDSTASETYHLIRDILEAVCDISPAPFLHLGGDEAIGMSDQEYRDFWRRALPIARSTGKQLIMWQEASRGYLEPGDIAQLWIGFDPAEQAQREPATVAGMAPHTAEELAAFQRIFAQAPQDAARALQAGALAILSPSTHLYLDTAYAEASTDAAQTERASRVGAPFYTKQTVRQFYEWSLPDAVPGVRLGPDVAGVEGAIWCETVRDFADLQFLLLPRLAGVAEKAWSHAEAPWDDYRGRLAAQEPTWRAAGWDYYRSSEVW